jgi:hypothetical protein
MACLGGFCPDDHHRWDPFKLYVVPVYLEIGEVLHSRSIVSEIVLQDLWADGRVRHQGSAQALRGRRSKEDHGAVHPGMESVRRRWSGWRTPPDLELPGDLTTTMEWPMYVPANPSFCCAVTKSRSML